MEYVAVSVTQRNRQRGVKPKMRGSKLRSVLYWHGEIKQKYAEQVEC